MLNPGCLFDFIIYKLPKLSIGSEQVACGRGTALEPVVSTLRSGHACGNRGRSVDAHPLFALDLLVRKRTSTARQRHNSGLLFQPLESIMNLCAIKQDLIFSCSWRLHAQACNVQCLINCLVAGIYIS